MPSRFPGFHLGGGGGRYSSKWEKGEVCLVAKERKVSSVLDYNKLEIPVEGPRGQIEKSGT